MCSNPGGILMYASSPSIIQYMELFHHFLLFLVSSLFTTETEHCFYPQSLNLHIVVEFFFSGKPTQF